MNKTAIQCRSCGHAGLEPVLSLGQTPLANSLRTAQQLQEPERVYPLEAVFCPECTLVQLTESVPPAEMFSEYLYFSSFSETMLRHAEDLVTHVLKSYSLRPGGLVVEVASNDGYLLQYYRRQNIDVLGIEPAENIARAAVKAGIPTLCEFFGDSVGKRLRSEGKSADVIHAHNVLAHVPDLHGFAEGVQQLLAPAGVAVIEVPYVKDLIDHCEFDTIYHEHLFYFSLTALDRLFSDHNLVIERVDRVPIHGGSLRLFLRRAEAAQRGVSTRELLDEEATWGVELYKNFGERVAQLKEATCALLKDLKAQGKRLAAYGASAKGSTLLNYFGIGRDLLDFVVDRSTIKQGHYTPGTHLPILAPATLLTEKPDYLLLLTWNFADEILKQQEEYRRQGGKFVIPIPELRVV